MKAFWTAAMVFLILGTKPLSALEEARDKEFLLASQMGVAAIKRCNTDGASTCLPDLSAATLQLSRSFEIEKLRLARAPCGSETWQQTTSRYMLIVQGLASGIVHVMDFTATLGQRDRSELSSMHDLSNTLSKVMAFGAEMLLTSGDIALRAGCRAEADSNYRAVLKIFVADDMAAYRERARVGIDDARRGDSLLCKTIGFC